MQFPWVPLLPLLHVIALLALIGAIAHMKKHAIWGGVLIVIAFLCALATASLFVVLFRAGI